MEPGCIIASRAPHNRSCACELAVLGTGQYRLIDRFLCIIEVKGKSGRENSELHHVDVDLDSSLFFQI